MAEKKTKPKNKTTSETLKIKYLHETVLGSKMILHTPLICDHTDRTLQWDIKSRDFCLSSSVLSVSLSIFPFFCEHFIKGLKSKSSLCFPTARVLLEQQGTLSFKKEDALVACLYPCRLAACIVYLNSCT